ncbi:TonB-dependent receptor [Paucibacter sp. M5-1]|uniref:TonB-dependent receptor n=1 Tax=Paucibacter sp. M5-1 TaxID=3015998 RepID=UPI0022B8642B|nr:TonB-dependent receptor [Paucibacter sp. M5-1]MCZ7881639.1 TonB-dependent receptor [Paucibacter sp. M5-1]
MNTTPRLSLLALCLLSAFSPVQAQDSKPAETLDRVLVTGQAANLRSALAKQQAAQGIVNIVHADAIGQLPDNNAAEALARLPGVSVERDQGEGRFIRVRGLGPDYNAVTINGATMPASEADRRAPGLDVVPAGLIRSLEVSKTLTPEQDANSIGGSVSVNTLSAFDLAGRLFSVELGANHDANAGKTRPRGSLTFADRFAGQRLGVALALSADQRRFASDNVETGGAWDGDKLEEFELRRYEITRERVGAALNLDYRPAAGQQFYLRGFASRFSDREQRESLGIAFEDAQASGASGAAEAVRSLKSRTETAKTLALSLGTELQLNEAWRLWAETGLGRASEQTPDGIAGAGFAAEFDGVGFVGGKRPALQGPAAVRQDSKAYELDEIELENSHARDRVRHAKLDLQREFDLAGGAELTLKGGLKATRRHKSGVQETYKFGGGDLGDPTLAELTTGRDLPYAWGSFGQGISDPKLRRLLEGLDRGDYRDEIDSSVNDFEMHEDVNAGYLQLGYKQGATELLGGLRHEHLAFRADGTASVDDELQASQARTRSRHWLPSLLLKQGLSKELQLRAALTNSVLRPSFGQLSPGLVIDGDEAELGNPLLKPLRSRNLDLGLERALGRDGALSAYVFHKSIRDFVFQTDLAGSPGWEDFDEVISYANGGKASVRGVELAYSQALRQLPAPWNGLVVGVNATFVDSKAAIGGFKDGQWQQRQIKLPSQSDRTLNLSLGWEGQGWSTRLALNHKSPYLLEVGDVFDAGKDLKVDRQNQLDFSLRYQIARRWQLSLEALNLTNERYYVYQADNKARNAQYEQYGRSIKLGVKLALD